jgi:Bacterial Ig-like domain (group 3)/Beta-propeller repeat/Dockerin type I domain
VLEHAPVIYQQVAGAQQPVSGQFVLLGNNEVGVQVGSYDATQPLVIDPVLSYNTYLGGNGDDSGFGIAVNGSGNAYVASYTQSANFPATTGAFQTSLGGGYDAYVAKLNTSGTALVYSTYLGGNSNDYGLGIAVDGSGNAYVTGYTQSTNFPTTTGTFQTGYGGSQDAFVTKLNIGGTALVYSTYLGGNNTEQGIDIKVDVSGNTYITGYTQSTNFPTTTGAFQTNAANSNVKDFVTKLNTNGTGLVYSTYLGGNNIVYGRGIAVDGSGNAYVTGYTNSTNFPTTTGSFHTSLSGGYDDYVTKLNASGTGLVYSTYLGGSGDDGCEGIAVDSSGNAYLTGFTFSSNIPTTTNAFQTSFGGGSDDGFLTKLNASGTALLYSTYLGGNGADFGKGIAVDGSGNVYVTGPTSSTNFPTTTGAFQTNYGGGNDGFVSKFALLTSTTTSLIDNGPNPSIGGQTVNFTGTVNPSVPAGETILLEDASNGNAVVATTTIAAGGFSFNVSNLPAGTHNLFAVYSGDSTYAGSQSSQVNQVVSAPPSIAAVVINQDISALYNAAGQPSAGVQRSMVNDAVYTFSEPVNIISSNTEPNVFTISYAPGFTTGTGLPTLDWEPVANSNNTQWAVTFNGSNTQGGSILNGEYVITVNDPTAITAVSDSQQLSLSASGIGSASQSFYRLYGDINGDELVNAADNVQFKQALTSYNAAFDFNADGFVNASDNVRFKQDLTINYSGFTPTI